MGLQTIQYLFFLAVSAGVYLHLPRRIQPVFLLAASGVFYALASGGYLAVTLAVGAFSYLCGLGIAWKDGAHKQAFVRLGVIGSVAILAFFKYFGFLNTVLPAPLKIVMPLGISFYSFAAIAYLIDAGRGDCEVERNPLYYFLFLTFFGTVTQGPIPRAGALIPQLRAEHRFDAQRTVRALRLYAVGLFKMVAVSDVLGMVVDEVFGAWQSYGGGMLLLAAVFYTFQLYFNFSGYSELARATGLVLGLELTENFKTPFFATNFSGFWSRWHISFSSWLQDYLFMPLAWADTERLTGGKLRRLPPEVCVFIVFFVSGFWHGNTLPFVVWGLLQALYRVGEELLHRRLGKPKRKLPPGCCGPSVPGCSCCGPSAWSSSAWAPATVRWVPASGIWPGWCRASPLPALSPKLTPPPTTDFMPTASWWGPTTPLWRWCWRWPSSLIIAAASASRTRGPKSWWRPFPAGGGRRCTWRWSP